MEDLCRILVPCVVPSKGDLDPKTLGSITHCTFHVKFHNAHRYIKDTDKSYNKDTHFSNVNVKKHFSNI